MRVVLCDSPPCWRAPDGTRRRPIETLGRWRTGRARAAKRVRGGREISRPRSSKEHPGREEAQGSIQRLSVLTTRRTPGTLGRGKTQEPRLARPAYALGVGNNRKRNGMWARCSGNAGKTWREGKTPKGESQERCRCERKPARTQGE